jgi:endonuclease III
VTFREVLAQLGAFYGRIRERSSRDWFELVLLENAAYLVDDARRARVFDALRRQIGSSPEAILAASPEAITVAIADGGMKPPMRAAKVRTCAELALRIGRRELERTMKSDPVRAKKLLRQFPGIGEPSADKILLFCAGIASLAPDSNALRVTTRVGLSAEQASYPATYRAAVAAADGEHLTLAESRAAHTLLRRHGQELCKRSAPRCDLCVLRDECVWYARQTGDRSRRQQLGHK